MQNNPVPNLQTYAYTVAKTVVTASYRSHVGHIGSALSISDIISVLYHRILRLPHDKCILSKGHAGVALYAALYLNGILSERELQSFANENGGLCEHPEISVSGIDMTSGSLGYGIGYGAGIALAMKKSKTQKNSRVYVIISDGECNEGSIWEAAIFAANQNLDNLTVIVDNNGWQCFGKTNTITDLGLFKQKWEAFGFAVREVDGHDLQGMDTVFSSTPYVIGKPSLILANTIAGHGVSFMERTLEAHYMTLNEPQFQQALEDIMRTYSV